MFTVLIFIYAAVLAINGLAFQYFAESRDVALLTPVFFAGLMIIMGILTLKNDLKLYGRHGALGLSVLAFITSVGSFIKLITFSFNEITYNDLSDFLTATCSLVFLIIAVYRQKSEQLTGKDISQK